MSYMSDFAERRKRVREQMDQLAKQKKEMRASLRPKKPKKPKVEEPKVEEPKKPKSSRIKIIEAKIKEIEREFEVIEKSIRRRWAVNPYEDHSAERKVLDELAMEKLRRIIAVAYGGRNVTEVDEGVTDCGPPDIFPDGEAEDAEWEFKSEDDIDLGDSGRGRKW